MDDPYPAWQRLREHGPVYQGTLHGLTGFGERVVSSELQFPYRPHFSVFSYEACAAAFRNQLVFAPLPRAVDIEGGQLGPSHELPATGCAWHQRYRRLVQPSFMPLNVSWWIQNWMEKTAHLLIDGFASAGHAELLSDFCAAMPVLAITCSLGFPVERALDIGDELHQPAKFIEVLAPIVAARRKEPRDDLISALVTAQLGGNCEHELSNAEIYSFSLLLVSAASTTMSRQMGIALAALLQRPKLLRAVSADRLLMRLAIDESLRWMPADPTSSRWAARDIDFYGVHMPKASIVQLCVGAANRDPSRWERPDEYDIGRPLRSSLAFGEGSHICLGMWVARLGMMIGTAALLDRLPNLRLDPGCERPRIIGMYERSATALPVRFGSPEVHNARWTQRPLGPRASRPGPNPHCSRTTS